LLQAPSPWPPGCISRLFRIIPPSGGAMPPNGSGPKFSLRTHGLARLDFLMHYFQRT
jgi:hypothetical protein